MTARRRGFTLIEAALSTAIVGTMLVASTGVFGGIARARAQQGESRLAYLLAQQLMTEIMQCPFGQASGTLGPAAGQARTAFGTVDAYNGYTANPPPAPSGGAMADYAGWTIASSVSFADPADPNASPAASTLKRIVVTVTTPSGKPFTLAGLRSKFGPYEQAPFTQTTYVTGIHLTLQGATPAKTVTIGAHPLNVTTSQ